MTNNDFNPYQTPQAAEEQLFSQHECWRDGKTVYLPPESDLPHCCVRCGEAAQPPARPSKLYWHSPHVYWVLLLVFITGGLALLLYAVLALLLRKKVLLTLCYCPKHIWRRRLNLALAIVFLVLLLLPFLVIFSGEYREINALLVIVPLALLLLMALFNSIIRIRATHIDENLASIKGFGQGFLQQIPEDPLRASQYRQ